VSVEVCGDNIDNDCDGYVDEWCQTTTCDDTALNPTSVEVNGWAFTVTCNGTNANMYKVKVQKPNGATEWVSVPNNQNWINYNPDTVGTYKFTCKAIGANGNSDTCDTETGTVYEANECTNPVTNLTITSLCVYTNVVQNIL